jgi:hypothetical protein
MNQMLDAGCWILDARCKMWDSIFNILHLASCILYLFHNRPHILSHNNLKEIPLRINIKDHNW